MPRKEPLMGQAEQQPTVPPKKDETKGKPFKFTRKYLGGTAIGHNQPREKD